MGGGEGKEEQYAAVKTLGRLIGPVTVHWKHTAQRSAAPSKKVQRGVKPLWEKKSRTKVVQLRLTSSVLAHDAKVKDSYIFKILL